MFGQIHTAEKSNGIIVIPELLNQLDLTGCMVSIDVMGTQVVIARTIIKRDGDNRRRTLRMSRFNNLTTSMMSMGVSTRSSTQLQTCLTISQTLHIGHWARLKVIGDAMHQREMQGQMSREHAYYLLSYVGDVKRLVESV